MSSSLHIIFAIAPIFAIIMFGYFLRKIGKLPREFLDNSDFLIFWVFLPTLFFTKISNANLDSRSIPDFSIILFLIFIATLIYSAFTSRGFNIPKSLSLPMIQGCCRINTVIILSIANALYGARGLEIAVIGASIMVPAINSLMPIFLLFLIKDNNISIIRTIKREILSNPIILSIILGFVFNFYDLKNIPILHDVTSILSKATLPIMLLSLGASLKIKEIKGQLLPIVISNFGKLIFAPIITIILCFFALLPPDLSQIAIIYGSVPTGVVVYSLVKRANGEVKLASAIVTSQILLSFITIPFFIIISDMIFR